MREGAGGITAFATDQHVAVAAFALSGRLFVAGLLSGQARELVVDGPVFDPRPDPVATRVAYVSGRSLRIAELDGSSWELAGEETARRSAGAAPTSSPPRRWTATAATGGAPTAPPSPRAASTSAPCSAGTSATLRNPDQPANEVRYPAAGTTNADVTPARAGARRRQHAGGVGPRHLPVPRRRAVADARSPAAHRAVPRPALADGARGRPRDRRTPSRCSPTATTRGSNWCRARPTCSPTASW